VILPQLLKAEGQASRLESQSAAFIVESPQFSVSLATPQQICAIASIASQAVLADGARKLWDSDRHCAIVGTGQLALDKVSLIFWLASLSDRRPRREGRRYRREGLLEAAPRPIRLTIGFRP